MSPPFSDPLASSAKTVPFSPAPAQSTPALDSALYGHAFNALPIALLLVEAATGTVLAANHAFSRLQGNEDTALIGRHFSSLTVFRDRPELCATLQTVAPGQTVTFDSHTASGAQGGRRRLELTAVGLESGSRAVIQCSFLDLTARQHDERRLQQTDKMQALRLLAGTAAHDFNNVLTCVRGYVSIALETRTLPADLREILNHTQGAAVRATEFTNRLLGFSRRHKLQLQPVELGAFLTALVPQLQATLPREIHVGLSVNPSPLLIAADPAALRRVLEMLVKNAHEALGERGRITLSLSPGEESPSPAPGSNAKPASRFARLAVQDEGRGVPTSVQARLFEPGFTTKKSGGTAGMSLANAYSIIADHGGWIDLQSEEGRGSTFTLLLPLAEQA